MESSTRPTHNRRSIRLKDYDYTQAGGYFITAVTFNRACLLGTLVEGVRQFSALGEIIVQGWQRLSLRFPFIELDEFVCMPNHMHGIIVLPDFYKSGIIPKSNQNHNETRFEKFGASVKGSIPTIIRSYKSAVTQHVQRIKGTNTGPVWQPGFYEHVIRTELELNRIRQYILSNPIKWGLDEENPDRKKL